MKTPSNKRVRHFRTKYEVQYRHANKSWHYGGTYESEDCAGIHATKHLAPYYDQVRVLTVREVIKKLTYYKK